MKFFAFFDLDKLKKIFTALILERSILVVSRDLENLTSCGLSLEYLMYPLEWLQTFVPIMPEHIGIDVFNQPFPFIYGTHPSVYERLDHSQLENALVLLVDEKKVLNGDRERLPDNINTYLTKRLDYFGQQQQDISMNSASASSNRVNMYNLLNTGSIKPFVDSVLMIIDNYRDYMVFDYEKSVFRFDEVAYFKIKNEYTDKDAVGASKKYDLNNTGFYHQFRTTQSFMEVFLLSLYLQCCRNRFFYYQLTKFYIEKPVTSI
jgi:hypothetical protein